MCFFAKILLTKQNVTREKLCKALLYKKFGFVIFGLKNICKNVDEIDQFHQHFTLVFREKVLFSQNPFDKAKL